MISWLCQLFRILNFLRFIHNYTLIAVALKSLLRGKSNKLKWMEEASAAFKNLKEIFTTALIFKHTDPNFLWAGGHFRVWH